MKSKAKTCDVYKMFKKILIIIAISLFIGGCGKVANETIEAAPNSQDVSSFGVVVDKLDTPEKCFDWMQNNFTYQSDQAPADEFRSPAQTFELRYGDCDDYAVFAEYILRQHGYSVKVVTVYNAEQGHAVCVWEDAQNNYNYLSNQSIRKIAAVTLSVVAQDIYPDWTLCAVYPDNGFILRNSK